MTCNNCGAKAPVNANFCPTCGHLLRPNEHTPDAQWEVCEIRFRDRRHRFGLRNTYEFEAVALSPRGTRVVDTTGRIAGRFFQTVESVVPALEAMTERLIADGWQPLPSSLPLNLPRFWREIEPPAADAAPDQP